MKFTFTSLVSLLILVASAMAQPVVQGSITHGGLQRAYRLYQPNIYTGTEAVPLIINLHGYGSQAFEQEVYGSFKAIADTANFIIVHPEGTMDNAQNQFWNAFGIPGGPDDVGFLSALIDSISADYNIDPNRVYCTGMSNGGFMSYKMACDLGSRIAAIASVTGTMVQSELSACNLDHPTPIMEIHGTADPTVPYLGDATQTFVGTEAVVNYWVSVNNCNPTAVQSAVPDVNALDGCTADHFVYSGGDAGSTVEHYRINGGGHTWPGSPTVISIGVTNQDFSASVEIWRFFNQYRLNVLTTGIEQTTKPSFTIYPNPSEGEVAIRFETAAQRTFELRNSLGQLLRSDSSKSATFRLHAERAGVYFLTVFAEDGIFTEKLVIN
ncbi:MAG: T9SS type A sorting domain-containing protein [Flavobacteriales bacterium]|nr:T9SS type A sorting domain-containing protein [Flavobacteriales bacterium]